MWFMSYSFVPDVDLKKIVCLISCRLPLTIICNYMYFHIYIFRAHSHVSQHKTKTALMWKKISREVQRTQLHRAVPKEGADSPLMIVFKASAHIHVIRLRAFTHFLLQNLQVFSAAPYFWRHMWTMKNIFLYQIHWKLNIVLANSLLFTHFFWISEPEQRESRTSAMEGFCIQSEWLPHLWFCTDALVCWWIPSSSLQTAFAGNTGKNGLLLLHPVSAEAHPWSFGNQPGGAAD